MIDTKNTNLTLGMKETWKKGLNKIDPRFTEYFFHQVYQPSYGYACVENGQVKGSVCCIPHAFMFNGRVLQASMLSKLAILPGENKEAITDELMECILDRSDHQELITLLKPEEEGNYQKYGFKRIFDRSRYTIRREDMTQTISNLGCSFDPSPVDMLKVYVGFIRRFNGFYARDFEYFVNLKKEIVARGGKIVAYYNSKEKIQGYATILIEGKTARIEECVYLESTALMKLINAALQERGTIYLEVTPEENIAMLFPNSEKLFTHEVYARLNNPELFSRLFNTHVETIEEAFQLSHKPLNLNENY